MTDIADCRMVISEDRTWGFVYANMIIPVHYSFQKGNLLKITVKREPRIEVRAPRFFSEKYLFQELENRAEWISKQLQKLDTMIPVRSVFEYRESEVHLFMGSEYPLRIQHGKRAKVWLSLFGIEIEVPDPANAEQARKALLNWYAEQTAEYVSQRAWFFVNRMFPEPFERRLEFKFRKMKTVWGSCSAKGTLIFNKQLIRLPRELIDYIIIHELCHLKQLNHSAAFYTELEAHLPEWKDLTKRLWAYTTEVTK